MRSQIKDTQVIELIGRNCLGSQLLRDGLDIAVPARDRGIDLIAYADRSSRVKEFTARPIQMKAASEKSFSIDVKYEKIPDLIIAYIWHVHEPNAIVTYALTYAEALRLAKKCWPRAANWKRERYSTSKPSVKLCNLLKRYEMTEGKWWKRVTGTKYKGDWGTKK
jgi:hypothetical protein